MGIFLRTSTLASSKRRRFSRPTARLLAATRDSLCSYVQEFTELRTFLRERIPESQRTLGDHNFITLKLQHLLARSLLCDRGAAGITQELVDEAEQLFTDLTRTYRQVLGRQHPDTRGAEGDLETFLTWKAKSPFR